MKNVIQFKDRSDACASYEAGLERAEQLEGQLDIFADALASNWVQQDELNDMLQMYEDGINQIRETNLPDVSNHLYQEQERIVLHPADAEYHQMNVDSLQAELKEIYHTWNHLVLEYRETEKTIDNFKNSEEILKDTIDDMSLEMIALDPTRKK